MMAQPVQSGDLAFGAGVTHYRIVGRLEEGKTPLVVVHGGPGMTWDYLEELDALASAERAVVYYDQVGNGGSRPLGANPIEEICLGLFLDQLDHLLDNLRIAENYSLFAHSSGVAIALEHAIRRPKGLKALVLANGFAATRLMRESIQRLRTALPVSIRETLELHEASGTTESPEYAAATGEFMLRHVCRAPFPPGLTRTLVALAENPQVFAKLWGPSVFDGSGAYADWNAVGRLGSILAPTLAYRGEFDEAGENCIAPFADISGIKWSVFEGASHLPHIEVRTNCLSLISSFLAEVG